MRLSPLDQLIVNVDTFLKSVVAHDPSPLPKEFGKDDTGNAMPEEQKREAAALMRVNHVGEICAQALYRAHALTTQDHALQRKFDQAAEEEKVHLDWTRARIEQLGGRPSLLNPLWYAGAFGIGLVAGRMGSRISLGFMAETERQVEEHLASHLERLPIEDTVSRSIVQQMKQDEARHANQASEMGGVELPLPVRLMMRAAAKVMTTVAHRV